MDAVYLKHHLFFDLRYSNTRQPGAPDGPPSAHSGPQTNFPTSPSSHPFMRQHIQKILFRGRIDPLIDIRKAIVRELLDILTTTTGTGADAVPNASAREVH